MGIKDEQESWKVNPDEVSTIVTNYYQQQFTSTRIDPLSSVLTHVPIVITKKINSSLCREFKEEEVLLALKQMTPRKAPSPDGMPLFFFPPLKPHFCYTHSRD